VAQLQRPLNEMHLWYPSRQRYVENICYKGIDFTTDLSDGPVGSGKYFFTQAFDAHLKKAAHRSEPNTTAYMFLCEAVTGERKKVNLILF